MQGAITGLVVVAALGLVLTGCGDSDDGETTTNTTLAPKQPTVFNVSLQGTEETPGPGDLDGTGTAEITMTPGATEVCYSLTVTDIDNVTAAHIHEGRAGTAGPIAITLEAPVTGRSKGCSEATGSIITGLRSGTRSFYVNVHSTDFPDGAVRAQLTG